MRTADGRQWANREDLAEHSGYNVSVLYALWMRRRVNGHPEARDINGVKHWDLAKWDAWLESLRKRPRDLSGVDRSGHPRVPLSPTGQARVLGVDRSRISQYSRNPPPGWPEPCHVEKLTKRGREFRTREQLWAWVDDPISGFGSKGGRYTGSSTGKTAEAPGRRVQLAVEALTEMSDRKAGEIAAILAQRHGQSVDSWKRSVTEARRRLQD
ncbi:hypothetical protein AB0465_37455 [Streptomyces griseoviridis]|uniref:hypothetical protein n=1 Tax=Streptomyces griseoviridis TaxID=45398 RepID=UPI003450EE4F